MADSVIPSASTATMRVVIIVLLVLLALEILKKFGVDPIGMVSGAVPGPATAA